jgi:predicted TIM-barrel fold metal-dependent hydrolase
MSVPVIDFHIHTTHYEQYSPALLDFFTTSSKEAAADWPAFYKKYSDPVQFTEYITDCGADYGVILAEYCPISTGISTNENVYNFCRSQEKLIPFACLNPYLISDPASELDRLVKEMGFRGLKLYPTYDLFYPNEPIMYPIYAKAQELGIPVMMHTGSSTFFGTRIKYGNPIFFDDIAVDFPNLNLLMCHCGRGFWYDEAFFLSRLHKNLYMEISGLPPKKLLSYFPEFERNADKIIFGSDWPGLDIKKNIEAIRELPLKEENKVKVLGGNAARLLKL